ncbi:MAG: hypothetical protein K6G50_06865 [bacterium]|nr:hypothetical protein [bacterium]
MNYSERIDRVKPLVKQASIIAMDYFGKVGSTAKSDGSPVTKADKEVELLLRDGLKKRFPGETIVGEENGTETGSSDCVWSIDPIDGTAAYISRLPHWGISVGFFYKREPVLGVVYFPALEEMYWGAKGCGAYLQTGIWGIEKLSVSKEPVNSNTLAMIPSSAHRNYASTYPGKLRSLGSTAYHILLVARGTAIGSLMKVYQWDYAGSMPILFEAGGLVKTLDGKDPSIIDLLPGSTPPSIIVSTPNHMSLMQSSFKELN